MISQCIVCGAVPPGSRGECKACQVRATGWRGDWLDFAGRVEARMAQGAEEYGGNSYGQDPAALVDEVRQELLDVAGWASILDARLAAIGAKLARVEVSQSQPARCHEDRGRTDENKP